MARGNPKKISSEDLARQEGDSQETLSKKLEDASPLIKEARESIERDEVAKLTEKATEAKAQEAETPNAINNEKRKLIQAEIEETDKQIEQIKKSLEFQRRMEEGRNPSGQVEAFQTLLDGAEKAKSELGEELKDPEAYAKKNKEEFDQMVKGEQAAQEKKRLEAEKRREIEKKAAVIKEEIEGAESLEELYAILNSNDAKYTADKIKRMVDVHSDNDIGDPNFYVNLRQEYISGVDLSDTLAYQAEALYRKSKRRWYKPWTWSK